MHAAHLHHGPCGPSFQAMTGRGPRHRRKWAGPGFGSGFGPGGPRAKRGDVRAAILALLAEEPRNGYQVIQEINERTQGVWSPSPGAVYPALSQLEDEGLVRAQEVDGKRVFALTDEGKAHVEEHKDEIGKPWEKVTEGVPDSELALRDHVRQLIMAMSQVAQTGDETLIEEAKKILSDARKALYRLLAGD
jgi:DNA-binding PadR family transcriptional regulator